MSNDLVTRAGQRGLAAMAAGDNAFTGLAAELDVPLGAFLKYSGNDGTYQFKGQIIEHGTSLLFNMNTLKKGFICWKGGKPVEQKMVLVTSGERMPVKDELTDHGPYTVEGEGWAEQLGVQVINPADGTTMELNLSNRSGITALTQLAQAYGTKRKFNMDDDGSYKVPVVEISARSFTLKNAPGKKWAPNFEIVAWISEAEMAEYVTVSGDNDEDYDSADVEAVEVVEEPAPARAKPAAKPAPARAKPAPKAAAKPAPAAPVKKARPPAPVWDEETETWVTQDVTAEEVAEDVAEYTDEADYVESGEAEELDDPPFDDDADAPETHPDYAKANKPVQVQQKADMSAPLKRPPPRNPAPTGGGAKPPPASAGGVRPGQRRPG